MFSSIFSKPLIFALFISLSFNGLFGYLSYKFYSDKTVAEEQLKTAVDANNALSESLDKKELLCKASDTISAQFETEKQEIVKEKDGVLNTIDKMVSIPSQVESKPKRQENVKKQVDVVSLDDKLTTDLVRLLSESCIRARGSACDNP